MADYCKNLPDKFWLSVFMADFAGNMENKEMLQKIYNVMATNRSPEASGGIFDAKVIKDGVFQMIERLSDMETFINTFGDKLGVYKFIWNIEPSVRDPRLYRKDEIVAVNSNTAMTQARYFTPVQDMIGTKSFKKDPLSRVEGYQPPIHEFEFTISMSGILEKYIDSYGTMVSKHFKSGHVEKVKFSFSPVVNGEKTERYTHTSEGRITYKFAVIQRTFVNEYKLELWLMGVNVKKLPLEAVSTFLFNPKERERYYYMNPEDIMLELFNKQRVSDVETMTPLCAIAGKQLVFVASKENARVYDREKKEYICNRHEVKPNILFKWVFVEKQESDAFCPECSYE